MIQNSLLIVLILVVTEAGVLFFSSHKKTYRFFSIVPAVFWIYFLPMILSTIGFLPNEHVVYAKITTFGLPVALILLLLGVDLPAISKLGKEALVMMFAGSFGIVVGAPIVLKLFQPWLPEGAWMGFGALSGSWVGGSANMIAVKEAIGAPDAIFLPMITVDVVVAYTWMGFLIWMASRVAQFDQWNRSDVKLIQELSLRGRETTEAIHKSSPGACGAMGVAPSELVMTLPTGILGLFACLFISRFLPPVFGFTKTTWLILIASVLGLILSFTKIRNLENKGASKIGYWILYFVLTSIGAKANLSTISSAPILILAGFVWVLIHAAILILIGRILKAPLALTATASQANIGGPVSAPIVASVYHPSLAPLGLLLGILGNIMGTYFGLLCSYLCRLVS